MLNAIFRPVADWPIKKTTVDQRKKATFRASYSKTLDLLEQELTILRAQDIVIQAYFKLVDIRNDGWPKSASRPTEPGVILSFDAKKIAYSYPCDRFHDWTDNLRGIALSLQALRSVDRYGVTSGHEQYQGFKRLEAPKPFNGRDWAASVLEQHSGIFVSPTSSEEVVVAAWRHAVRKLHPDQGGNPADFEQIQKAREILLG